jgi:prevent-host-death family protein
MITVNMHEAKSQLSKLVLAATKGEEVILCSNGLPKVRLIPFSFNPGERDLTPDPALSPFLAQGYDPAEPLALDELPADRP